MSVSPPTSIPAYLEQDWQIYGGETHTIRLLSEEDASAYCRRLAFSQYENFSVASWFIPKALRRDFFHVYAYCRWSDDLADASPDRETAINRLEWWESQLEGCFAGAKPTHPVFIALQSTVRKYQLNQKPFSDLLSAFLQDQHVLRYTSDSQLLDYCQRSANPVGRILLQISAAHDKAKLSEQQLDWSDTICSGLQLANFAQDMHRDAQINRIYLPQSRWQKFGLDEQTILAGLPTESLKQTLKEWVGEIRAMFLRGWQLHEHVPAWLARDIRLFAGGGLMILKRIEASNFDVWTQRIEVSKADKLYLLLRAFFTKQPLDSRGVPDE